MKEQLSALGQTSFIYGIGQALSRLLSLLLLPFFVKYLTTADYGVSGMLNVVTFVAISIFSLGLGSAIAPSYFSEADAERRGTTIWTAFILLLASSALLAAVGLSSATALSRLVFGVPDHARLVTLTVLTTCFNVLSIPFAQQLQFEARAKAFVAWTLASAALTLGTSIVLVGVLRFGLTGYVEANLIGQAGATLLVILISLRSLTFRWNTATACELLRLGGPLIPAFGFLFVLQQAARVVLKETWGLDAVGVYTIGINLGSAVALVVSAFTSAWTPFFMSYVDRRNEARDVLGRVVTYYVIGMGALSLLFFFAAKPAVMLLTAPAFYPAYLVVGLAACAQVLGGLFNVLLPGVYFAKEVRVLTVIHGTAAALTVGAAVILVPPLGVLGASLVLVIGSGATACVLAAWNYVRRRDYVGVRYERGRLARFGTAYVLLSIAALWTRTWPLSAEIAFALALSGCLAIVLWLALTKSERVTAREYGHRLLAAIRGAAHADAVS